MKNLEEEYNNSVKEYEALNEEVEAIAKRRDSAYEKMLRRKKKYKLNLLDNLEKPADKLEILLEDGPLGLLRKECIGYLKSLHHKLSVSGYTVDTFQHTITLSINSDDVLELDRLSYTIENDLFPPIKETKKGYKLINVDYYNDSDYSNIVYLSKRDNDYMLVKDGYTNVITIFNGKGSVRSVLEYMLENGYTDEGF